VAVATCVVFAIVVSVIVVAVFLVVLADVPILFLAYSYAANEQSEPHLTVGILGRQHKEEEEVVSIPTLRYL